MDFRSSHHSSICGPLVSTARWAIPTGGIFLAAQFHTQADNRMSRHTIVILDDDHVIRLARYALARPPEVSDDWVRAFFAPEPVDPQAVYAAADGLHASDGVTLVEPPASAQEVHAANPAIIIFRRGTVDAQLIAACPNLRLIQRIGARADSIDLAAAKQRGIHVSCMPRMTLIYTAEHAIMLMLALAKQLTRGDAQVRAGVWDRALVKPIDDVAYNWTGFTGLSGLYGKTLGIIGLGEVGSIMAGMAQGFGMQVLYCNRTRLPAAQEAEAGVRFAPRAELLAQSDFVSVNAANLPANRGMIDLETFKAMKPGAFFINTSRGKLVNEDDLFTALDSGLIAGAGLDVHWQEPRAAGDRLCQLPNLILTPHYAGGSRFGILDELKQVFDNCRAVLAGGRPSHSV
jgi:phosphoglycerate dehydrogenase-like enzyme